MNNTKIIIYTDGGARNNPGPAGAGAVIVDENGDVIKEVSKYLGIQTNNWAEYEAVILGFETAKALGLKEREIEFKALIDGFESHRNGTTRQALS